MENLGMYCVSIKVSIKEILEFSESTIGPLIL